MVHNIQTLIRITCLFCCLISIASVADSERYQQGIDAFARGDYRAAANIWLVEAYEGSKDAQFNLGVLYLEGKGVSQDRDDAIFWFSRAAESGHTQAQYNLGHLYFEEQGNPESLQKGVAWWKRASEQGFGIAQYNYARALYFGVGINKNLVESHYWMKQSARSGEDIALQFLRAHRDEFYSVADTEITTTPSDDILTKETPKLTEDTETASSKETEPAELSEDSTVDTPFPDATVSTGEPEINDEIVQSDTETEPSPVRVSQSFYVKVLEQSLINSNFNVFSPVVMVAPSGLMLRVMSIAGDWYEVRAPGGFLGWIARSSGVFNKGILTINTETQQIFADYTDDNMGNQIGFAIFRDQLLVMSEYENWLQVLAPEDNTAWIKIEAVAKITSSDVEAALNWQQQRLHRRSKNIDSPSVDEQVVNPEPAVEDIQLDSEDAISSATQVVDDVNSVEIESLTVDEFLAGYIVQETLPNLEQKDAEVIEQQESSESEEKTEEVIVETVQQENFVSEALQPDSLSDNEVQSDEEIENNTASNAPSLEQETVQVIEFGSNTEASNQLVVPVTVDEPEGSFSPTIKQSNSSTSTGIHNDNAWLYSKDPKRYTLQLFSVRERKQAITLFEEIADRGQVFSTYSNDARWYFIVVGDFATSAEALAYLPELPLWAQNSMVQSFSTLQLKRCEKLVHLAEYESAGLVHYCSQ